MKQAYKSSECANREMEVRDLNRFPNLPWAASGLWKSNYFRVGRLLLAMFFLPFAVIAQDATQGQTPAFEGWKIGDCQAFALQELAKADKGELKAATTGRITPTTKTIYIAKQTWLQEVPDTANGITFRYVNIDSNAKMIAEEVKKGTAAVY